MLPIETARYEYRNPETGDLIATKVRYEPKTFEWRLPDETPGLGELSERDLPIYKAEKLSTHPLDKMIVFVEGEKAADALEAAGVLAVCLPGGAAARPMYEQLKPLSSRKVVLWPDKDHVGRILMRRIYEKLRHIAFELRVISPDVLKNKEDAYNWLQMGYGKQELFEELKKNKRNILSQRVLNVEDLHGRDPKEIRWFWPGYLPKGMLTLIQGPKGIGKSWATLKIASHISNGEIIPTGLPSTEGPKKVLLLAHEDPVEEVLIPRLLSMGADMTMIKRLHSTADADTGEQHWLDLLRDLEQIEEEMEDGEYDLLIIDPINNYLPQSVDTYRDSSMRSVLTPLAEMANRLGVSVIGIRHLKKSREGDMIDWGVGSIAYGAVARMVITVLENPLDQDERLFIPTATNITAPRNPQGFTITDTKDGNADFKWTGERSITKNDLTRKAKKDLSSEEVGY